MITIKHKHTVYEIQKTKMEYIIGKFIDNDNYKIESMCKFFNLMKKRKLLKESFLSAICDKIHTKNGNIYDKNM